MTQRFLGDCCLIAFLSVYVGCNKPYQESSTGATQVKTFAKIPKNSKGNTVEQQNILDRIGITTDPTKVLWIHLIALDGKILRRMPIRCKVTSSSKRLEPKHAATGGSNSPYFGNFRTDEFIQADGTFGDSDDYIFWFDPMGRYHQWGTAGGLGYLLTDYPIDLSDPLDEITGLYKAHEAASQWQKEQETKLREVEKGG